MRDEFPLLLRAWKAGIRCWLSFQGPLHILFYDRLQTNLREEMVKLLQFLNWEVTESQLDCVLRDSEGKFHRKRASRIDNLELLSIEQLRRVTDAYEELDSLVEKRITGGMLVSF